MGRKLAYTVHVRQTQPVDEKRPELGFTVVREGLFEAGTELPDWAEPLVGKHVFHDSASEPEPVAENGQRDPGPTDLEEPSRNASLEEWQEYARARGATDSELEAAKRNDLRDKYSSK